jgi:hypothetical protein
VRGRWSRCGTTPRGLRRRLRRWRTWEAGSKVQCPLRIMSVNSWRRNWMCSVADLCGPRRKAARLRSCVQGSVPVMTGAPTLRRRSRRWDAGCCRSRTVGARSEVLWLDCTKLSQVTAVERRALASITNLPRSSGTTVGVGVVL